MKRTVAVFVVTLMLTPGLAIGSLFPPAEGDICFTVPFEFIVGDKALPSGSYIIRVHQQSGLVEICEDGVYCESVVSSPVEIPQRPEKPELAFRKYGDQYFLSQVWSTSRVGRHLQESSVQPNRSDAILTWEAAFVEGRLLCIDANSKPGLASTWH